MTVVAASLDIAQLSQPIIYGTDDRRELYLESSGLLRHFGERTVVALVEDAALTGAAGSDPRQLFAGQTWKERRDLCEGVRFAEQPSVAICSGVLVDADLVLTAGHCARNLDCNGLNLIFGYYYGSDGEAAVLEADDVYRCADAFLFDVADAFDSADYGWIRLDRPVSDDKEAATIDTRALPVSRDEPLHAFGFGGGLPLKIETNLPVSDPRPVTLDYFVAGLDAFEGASGGPIVRQDAQVVGIFARGDADYVSMMEGCNDVAVRPDNDAAEEVTYAFRAVDALCRTDEAASGICLKAPADTSSGACGMAYFHAHDSGASWWLLAGCVAMFSRPRLRRVCAPRWKCSVLSKFPDHPKRNRRRLLAQQAGPAAIA